MPAASKGGTLRKADKVVCLSAYRARPTKQDEDSHWRRRPHAIRIEPFPSAERVYTKQAAGWDFAGRSAVGITAVSQHRPLARLAAP
jgi:hypothetical protein